MEIIPVIDIKDGCAVHAIKGKRSDYQPIKTSLCPSSDPLNVISNFIALGNFKRMYIADLNAIMKQGNNDELLKRVVESFPYINFWIDKGLQKIPFLSKQFANSVSVIGSESLKESHLKSLESSTTPFVLSLDFSSEGRMGPDTLFTNEQFWPKNIIIMTLGRVGQNDGPDYQKLEYFCSRYPDRNFIAAGGIRNMEDLLKLKKMGIEKALVASALHLKSISAEDINCLGKEPNQA